ncbi:MAG: PAS domain S-box protein [Desulfosoma sp.]
MKAGMNLPQVSLKWILLGVLAAIAFGAGFLWFYLTHENAHEKETAHFLETIAQFKAEELANWVQDQKDDASALQHSTLFRDYLTRFLADAEAPITESLEDLLRYVATSHVADDVLVLDREGRVRFALSGAQKVHSDDAAALEEALKTGRPVMTDLHVDLDTDEAFLTVAVPVYGWGTTPVEALGGVLLVTKALRFINPITQAWPVPSSTGEVLLVRREGNEVVFLNALRHKPDAAFRLRLSLDRVDLPAAMAARGQTGVVQGIDYRGVPVTAAIMPVKGTPWFLVAKMDRQEIEAPLRKMSLSIVGHFIGFTAFLIVLVFGARQSAEKAYYERLYRAESDLRKSMARQAAVLDAMSDAVIATDPEGRVEVWNPEAEKLSGFSAHEVMGKTLSQILAIQDAAKKPVPEGLLGLARKEFDGSAAPSFYLVHRSGRTIPVSVSVSPLESQSGEPKAFIFCLRDESRERLSRRIMEIRLDLMERSETEGVDRILPKILQDVADLMESAVGFYVSLVGDTDEVQCVYWSEKMPENFCGKNCTDGHRHLEHAGMWAEPARSHKPLIINDSRTLGVGRGMPEGHGPVERLLVVPVIQDGKPRALLALANKSSEYTQLDAETLETLASFIHQVVEHRKAEEKLRQSEARYKSLFQDHKAVKLLIDPQNGHIVDANRAAVDFYGWSQEELTRMFIQQINTLPPEAVKERMKEVKEGRRGYFEFQHRLADGSVRDVEVYSSRIDVDGKPYLHSIIHDVTGRKRMEAERARWLTAIEQAGEVMLITDADGFIQYVNPAFEAVTGYTREEAVGQKPAILKSGLQDEAFYRDMWATLKAGKKWSGRLVNKKKDGTLYTEETTITPVKDAEGNVVNYVAVMRDITEKLQLEQQFYQAQKLESVGRLAGGVAHDYNNSLTIILGFADLALRELPKESLAADYIREITRAAERSVSITRQLLAFARKQIIEPIVMDLNVSVEGTLKMLRRLIGEDINLVWKPGSHLWKVKMDPVQLDQILANLCVNAKDAIGGVGTITLETANISIGEDYCATHAEFIPGDYVMLAVTDTGCGMDKDTLDKIFEPFFTTKELGKGTGLGLSTVYGIVRQNRGFINVYSEPGVGTTFKIYLPRETEEVSTPAKEPSLDEVPRGKGETVLLVEDDPVLLEMTKVMLEDLGYEVLAAANPKEASALAKEYSGTIDLLMTDVIMPDMNGKALATEVREGRAGVKVLYMSGYTSNVVAHHGILDPGVSFLAKPFGYKDLAKKIRETLDKG